MPLVSDIGGQANDQQIDKTSHDMSDWERKIDAIWQVLSIKKLIRSDELRRAIEQLPKEQYDSLQYYEKWASAIERLLLEKHVISQEQLDRKMSELVAAEG